MEQALSKNADVTLVVHQSCVELLSKNLLQSNVSAHFDNKDRFLLLH